MKFSAINRVAVAAAALVPMIRAPDPDSTPMEGFDADQVDEILGLKAKGLRSKVILPLGYRQEDADWLLPMAKVRKSAETLVTDIN